MFATHPASAERSRTLTDAATGEGGELGAAEYARRIAPMRTALLDDELKRGRFDESLVLLNRMLAREPGLPELLYFRGEARRQRAKPGDADLAVADLQAAAASGKEPAATHRALGYLQRGLEQTEAARQSFQRYLDKDPGAADAGPIRLYITKQS